jgi:A/G-specific adenine glycosylase
MVGVDEPSPALVSEALIDWFAAHARDLPWRRDRSPYRVWLSEVMLQQTRVETVIPYFERFLARFPTVSSLAHASLEEVLRVWEGLGYYARARNLHAAARVTCQQHGAQLPSTYEELRALPGFGAYTAGAVASIAFGQNVPAVDGNARRVLARLYAVSEDITRAPVQRRLRELAAALLIAGRAGEVNEALIELGATVCTPRSPRCSECPLRVACRGYAQGDSGRLPIRPARRVVPYYQVTAAATLHEGKVLVAQRRHDDMLGGLWEFPGGKVEEGEDLPESLVREMREELGVLVAVGTPLTVVNHAYTHFRITLHAYVCRLVSGEPQCLECAAYRWADAGALADLPMSVADRRVAEALLEYLSAVWVTANT